MNAPANVPGKPAPAAALRQLLNADAMKKQLGLALPKILPVERFLRALFTTMNRDPKLAECDRDSVLAGVMTAAQLGLEIDPTLGRAYLLPYRDNRKGMVAQLIVGYRGFVDLFYRSGQGSSIIAEAVYEKDDFEFALGLDPKLRHVPADLEDRGRLTHAYAVATLSNGGKVWRVLNRTQVMRAKKASRGADSQYSPWNTFEEEMWRKTAIRAIAKLLPLSPELRVAEAVDENADAARAHAFASAIDVTSSVEPEQQEAAAPAAGDAAPADPLAALTPKQRVNAQLAQCDQVGVAAADKATVLNKHAFDHSKAGGGLDDTALRILSEDLAALIRNVMEG